MFVHNFVLYVVGVHLIVNTLLCKLLKAFCVMGEQDMSHGACAVLNGHSDWGYSAWKKHGRNNFISHSSLTPHNTMQSPRIVPVSA